mmetsp:Transcript_17518/g.45549  ORF Transcript_17518/g.45549 Transcript_17518/m.45549 type:complete len:217 (+) Transcript_17518:686-1336(+)
MHAQEQNGALTRVTLCLLQVFLHSLQLVFLLLHLRLSCVQLALQATCFALHRSLRISLCCRILYRSLQLVAHVLHGAFHGVRCLPLAGFCIKLPLEPFDLSAQFFHLSFPVPNLLTPVLFQLLCRRSSNVLQLALQLCNLCRVFFKLLLHAIHLVVMLPEFELQSINLLSQPLLFILVLRDRLRIHLCIATRANSKVPEWENKLNCRTSTYPPDLQ